MIRFGLRLLVLSLVACSAPTVAHAITIQVGHYLLAPNQPGQTIDVMVTGGEMVSGVNIFTQIGDGGPELADYGLPAGVDGPGITAVDLKSGSIFANVPDPAVDQGSLPQLAVWSLGIAAPGGKVSANGRLATLTIDTTGFTAGRWTLQLSDVLAQLSSGPFATDFAGIPADVTNGSIRINGGAAGDTNGDGDVDLADLNNVRNHFGAVGGNPIGDTLPFNGAVDLADLNAVRNHFGALSPVPEPHGGLLALLSFAIVFGRGRRARMLAHRLPNSTDY